MDPGDLLRIAAAYADLGYAGGVDAALDATGDVLSAAYGAGYEVARRPATRQQEPGVPPLPDQFAERLDTMAAEASDSTTTGDLPPDVLARWAGVSRGEAIRQAKEAREQAIAAEAAIAGQRSTIADLQRRLLLARNAAPHGDMDAVNAVLAERDAAYGVIRAAASLRYWPRRDGATWAWSDGRGVWPMKPEYEAAVTAAWNEGPADEPDPLRSERG
jgi:hypothetical protein